MNIFAVDQNPYQAAEWLVDRHVVKMVLESCQLLSTAHRILDGTEYVGKSKTGRNVKRWMLPDIDMDLNLYDATHVNHPSAVWCRTTIYNYNWLYQHFVALMNEYTYRYGKVHKCESMSQWLVYPPKNIKIAELTPVSPAMPDEYKVPNDHVESYRNYYRIAKERMHSWKNRNPPPWI
jgi:hypothetical protein